MSDEPPSGGSSHLTPRAVSSCRAAARPPRRRAFRAAVRPRAGVVARRVLRRCGPAVLPRRSSLLSTSRSAAPGAHRRTLVAAFCNAIRRGTDPALHAPLRARGHGRPASFGLGFARSRRALLLCAPVDAQVGSGCSAVRRQRRSGSHALSPRSAARSRRRCGTAPIAPVTSHAARSRWRRGAVLDGLATDGPCCTLSLALRSRAGWSRD